MTIILLYYPILIIFTNSDIYLETKGMGNELPYYSLLRYLYTLSLSLPIAKRASTPIPHWSFVIVSILMCSQSLSASSGSLFLQLSLFFLSKILKFFFSLDPTFPYYHFLPDSLSIYSKTLWKELCVLVSLIPFSLKPTLTHTYTHTLHW